MSSLGPVARLAASLAISALLLPGSLWAASQTSKLADHLEATRLQAERGSIPNQLDLAAAYYLGRGVPKDDVQAARWYERAAKAGDAFAENQIGYFYQNGIGVALDCERAVHWFQLASASGSVLGKVNLGTAYLDGNGVPKNLSTARQLLLEAFSKGSGLAATHLGNIAYYGDDGTVDTVAAERWFQAGARLHDPQSAYNLAYFYAEAQGHVHDFAKAVRLLRFSSSKGYVPAKQALGRLLLNHPDLAASPTEARGLLERASELGNWKASIILGILARDGRGVPADPAQAWYYFHLSTLQGGPSAANLLAADFTRLRLTLPTSAQGAAASRARAWFEQHREQYLFVSEIGQEITPIYTRGRQGPAGE